MEAEQVIKKITVWGRIKYTVISSLLLLVSIVFIYAPITEPNIYESDYNAIFSIIIGIGLGWWGLALLVRVFNKTLSGIVKSFFALGKVRSTMKGFKVLFKLALLIGGIWLVIAIIIGIGPLWIIAILIFLIFLAVINR